MKVLFIGNRFHVLEILLKKKKIDLDIYVLRGSMLEDVLSKRHLQYNLFGISDKAKVLNVIKNGDYDVMVSNGCPFIIPVGEKISKKTLINIHPTFLPVLRGKTSLSGVFYNDVKELGATMHHISEKMDGGNIIYQHKIKITNDIDQGLVYYISFLMEGVVFKKGWNLLEKNNFVYKGFRQDFTKESYFNRTPDKMSVNFLVMNTEEIMRRVKSFGIIGQGCNATNIKGNKFKVIYDAQQIVNPFLINLFGLGKPGEVLLKYDNKYLVKTLDGIIRVSRYN